ncbi:complement component C8 gamma chain isoform X2 [Motacilla alba alba]|uniref:complement component C8 gamma chain isoform X2 n=1 Tax=Motacilla alba alba TaxID=1094192 RepID=UPI0018D594E9|nr:complement component C8 gamma chain isoform X2 [Motacilla alba alba]
MTPSSCHQGFWLPTLPAWPRRFPAVPASHTSAWRPCARSCSSGCSLRRGGRGRRRDGGRPLPRVRSKKWWLRRLSASTRWCHPCAMQLSGKWFLVGMASRCSYLAEHSHQLEATTVTMTIPDGQSLAISTFRKLDRMCWEIRQHYLPAQAPGHFLLKGHRKSSKVDVVVGEADPSSFLILYYQKGRSISVKLYGRTSLVSDAIVDKFEQRIRAVGLSEDVTYYFPTYGFCDSADEFHVLDETKL